MSLMLPYFQDGTQLTNDRTESSETIYLVEQYFGGSSKEFYGATIS